MFKHLGIVIAAGGRGNRFGAANKLLTDFRGKPLFIHCIENFSAVCPAANMVLVVPENDLELFRDTLTARLPDSAIQLVAGGKRRFDSSRKGLAALPKNITYAAIHDAARPLANSHLLAKCLKAAKQHGGAVPAKPVTDTLKKAFSNGKITSTVSRHNLWRVETPQVFELQKLLTAYAKAENTEIEFTDDASVMEYAGFPVYVVKNTDTNLKVTFPEDVEKLHRHYL